MTETGNRFSVTAMKAWDFWSDPRALGLSLEDAAAIADGSATEEQQERGRLAGVAAFNLLVTTPAGVSRPS